MAQTREEILDRIEQLKTSERVARRELASLSEQYKTLLVSLKSCHTKIEAYEKERLSLEASLMTIKKCKPRESGRTKKQPAKIDMLQAFSSLSKEERQALIAALSAM